MDDNTLFSLVYKRISDPETVAAVKRALAQGVVLDTWMNGEEEEQVSEDAEVALVEAIERLTSEALRTKAVFPNKPLPEQYVRCVFHEILFSTALYAAQKEKGRREVNLSQAEQSIDCLNNFIASEPGGLTAVGKFFFIVSAHEDLNAIAYYGGMKVEDFLLGKLHRPWSNIVLSPSLLLYQQLALVVISYTGKGNMVCLTERGREILGWLRGILSNAGEFEWRSNSQRWVIFAEMNYDKVFSLIFPDTNQVTKEYLEQLGIQNGMRVLEVGAGTGRATVDLGLCDLAGPTGSVVALDPTAPLLENLAAKCRDRGINNVEIVQGIAEKLPFPDNSFDAAVAVFSLHFTEAATAVAEMVRVTKPAGIVSAICPPPEFDLRVIPMVALWFHPLISLTERLGVALSERNGLPVGLLKKLFENKMKDVHVWDMPFIASAEDHQSFLAFFLKGGAFFQKIFCRLPYQERWDIMRRLEDDGARIATETLDKEKRCIVQYEAAYGRVPATKGQSPKGIS